MEGAEGSQVHSTGESDGGSAAASMQGSSTGAHTTGQRVWGKGQGMVRIRLNTTRLYSAASSTRVAVEALADVLTLSDGGSK